MIVCSGLLVAYLFLKEMKNKDGRLSWQDMALFYFHRFWRFVNSLEFDKVFEMYQYQFCNLFYVYRMMPTYTE